MKKLITAGAAMLMAFSLTGCQSDGAPSEGASQTGKGSTPQTGSSRGISAAIPVATPPRPSVLGVFPAPGQTLMMPLSIQINFSLAMSRTFVENLSSYDFRCGNRVIQIDAVTLEAGGVTAIVALSGLPALNAGESCSLSVSGGLRSEEGAAIGNNRIYTYQLVSTAEEIPTPTTTPAPDATPSPDPVSITEKGLPTGIISSPVNGDRVADHMLVKITATDPGASPSGVAEVILKFDGIEIKRFPASAGGSYELPLISLGLLPEGRHQLTLDVRDKAGNVAVALSPVDFFLHNGKLELLGKSGGTGGTAYTAGLADANFALMGFSYRAGSMIDQITPLWQEFNAAGKLTVNAKAYGGTGGTSGSLKCDTGFRVSGIHGATSNSRIKRLGLYCSNFDGTVVYKTATFGGATGGTEFSWLCKRPQMVHGLELRASSGLDSIGPMCR